jgi:sulfur relay (sulfurtransferase) DsrF/TusC family protein
MYDKLLEQARDKTKIIFKLLNNKEDKEIFLKIISNYERLIEDDRNYKSISNKIFKEYDAEFWVLKQQLRTLGIANSTLVNDMKLHIDTSLTELKKLEIRDITQYISFIFDSIYSYVNEDDSYHEYVFMHKFKSFLEKLHSSIVCNGKLKELAKEEE